MYDAGVFFWVVWFIQTSKKERHNIARSLFWGVKAHSDFIYLFIFASMADKPSSFAEEAVRAVQNMHLKKKGSALGKMS